MANCSRCGKPITFRKVDGRCVPLHLSGGCIDGGGRTTSTDYSGYSRSNESCCFLTNCPECGDEVFFIRFNGGCVWIDPPLGPPWYKHPCMDNGYIPTGGQRSTLVLNISFPSKEVGYGLILGVVKESEVSFSKYCTIICIETEKNDRYVLLVKHNAGFLIGKLVVFNPNEKSVALFDDAKYTYGVVSMLSFPLGIDQQMQIEQVICPECNVKFSSKNVKKHLKNQHWFRSL